MADQGLQASFIPKGDIKKKRRKSGGGFSLNVFLLISLIIFFSALAASTAVYLIRDNLSAQNEASIIELDRNRDNYGLSTVETFIELNNRLSAATIILDNHINTARIFEVMEQNTLTEVVISDFTFVIDENQGSVAVSALGNGPDFESVALQADEYARDNDIQDLILSDVSQDREGGVSFSINFTLDRNILIRQ